MFASFIIKEVYMQKFEYRWTYHQYYSFTVKHISHYL